ncbi:MAG: hypothetical protein Q4C47_08495, partial [Planctomycetia bacterium]|nr:hypothetical protein [Planctomycetia bacterium]
MNSLRITDTDDPRIEAFRGLRDRTLRGEELFIAEGILLVERLLHSRFPVDAVLTVDGFLPILEPWLMERAPETPLFVTSESLLREIAGFPFHRGALALGRRLPDPTFDQLIATLSISPGVSFPSRGPEVGIPRSDQIRADAEPPSRSSGRG